MYVLPYTTEAYGHPLVVRTVSESAPQFNQNKVQLRKK